MGTWQDAEQLAAAHLTYLGFAGVMVAPSGADGGLDVVAVGAAAQVKRMNTPTGSPDIQRLSGAAHAFNKKLFYATAYTSAALAAADALKVAALQSWMLRSMAGVRIQHRRTQHRATPTLDHSAGYWQLALRRGWAHTMFGSAARRPRP